MNPELLYDLMRSMKKEYDRTIRNATVMIIASIPLVGIIHAIMKFESLAFPFFSGMITFFAVHKLYLVPKFKQIRDDYEPKIKAASAETDPQEG